MRRGRERVRNSASKRLSFLTGVAYAVLATLLTVLVLTGCALFAPEKMCSGVLFETVSLLVPLSVSAGLYVSIVFMFEIFGDCRGVSGSIG